VKSCAKDGITWDNLMAYAVSSMVQYYILFAMIAQSSKSDKKWVSRGLESPLI